MAGEPFKTPQNERSFSALVDRVILETGRQSALLSVIQYVNLSVRECQTLGLFSRDLLEEQVTATANPHIYTRPRNYRSLRAVRYDTLDYYPKMRRPGRAVQNASAFYYAADDYYAFHGVQEGEVITMANYYWAKPLQYFGRLGTITTGYPGGPYDNRLAYYDISTDKWQYLNDTSTAYVDEGVIADGEDEEETRRLNATNWLVDDWWDMILAGAKAKLFKDFKDERATAAYAFYSQMQDMMRNTVGIEAEATSNFGDTI
jgi:hypothetical protein